MKTRNQRSAVKGQKHGGAALMLALWALFLLSAMVISWALDINSRVTLSGNANRALDAEAMASSGTEVALNPAVKPGSPVLIGGLGRAKTYEAHITGEGGRLDINWLVAGEDPTRLGVLRQYLTNKGIEMNDVDMMVDSLLDWVEPDGGLHHLNAPPESDNYHPAHSLLMRIDELKKVAGWADFTSTPGWDDDFTVNTIKGVDLVWASRDVLLSLPGVNQEMADRFLQLRAGPDGIDGTADDTQFIGLDDALMALGVQGAAQLELFKKLTSFKDPVYRVVSVGKAGTAIHTIQMVFRRVGIVPQLISWKEF